ncbi:BspA family leucine-rich repeat surface protein [Lactococcus petauri]|uniref:BspA family leucine-rich repeat surface protein n=1 Tax=Lactococcus petauri TaxID=1940789 RepID=UPI003853D8F0
MKDKTPKTIKHRLRKASQWLLIGLLTTSTTLPGIVTTVTASTEESNVSQAINTDIDINEKTEEVEQVDNAENLEVSDTMEEPDGEVGKEKGTTAETVQITPEETAANEIVSENNLKAEDDIASGNWGDTPWRIDADLTLHIGGGHLGLRSFAYYAPDYYLKVKKIVFDEEVRVNEESDGALFAGMESVVEIENLSNLDTSDMKKMSSMFFGMSSLTNLNLSNFDTSKVTTMSAMFWGLSSITNLDLSNFDTSNVTDMSDMFGGTGLSRLDISNFNTSKVTNMYGMFAESSALMDLDLTNFDTSNVADMGRMFMKTSSLSSLDLSSFDTKNVMNMSSMFNCMTKLSTLDISSFDTSNVVNMSHMFSDMTSLISLDISNFDTTSMPYIYMYKLFYGTYKLSQLTLGKNFDFGEDADLPEHLESDTYTGRWINVGNGSLEAPEGKNIWSSAEFMTNYNGDVDADIYIWQRQPVAGRDVTVKYEDESGKSIADEETLQGKVGEDYNSIQKDIDGYTFKEVKDDNASGKFTAQAQTVTYIYTKNPISEEDTETDVSGAEYNNSGSSDKGNSSDNGVLLTNVQNNQEQIKQKNQILPQTGEHLSAIAFMAGLSLLVLGSLFAVLRFKKNK